MGVTEKVDDAVVVGVDGSASGTAAVDWAADQARLEDRPLTLVHAATLGAVTTREVDARTVSALLHAEGRTVLQQAGRRAAAHRVRDVRSELVLDDPSAVLLQASRHAALMVVGSRGHGPVASHVMGSVGLDLVRRARCPVVVLRPGDEGPAGAAGAAGPAGGGLGVVVGVDEPEHAARVVAWAVRLADLRDLPLTLVHALPGQHPSGPVSPEEPGYEVAWGRLQTVARGLRDAHPRVRVGLRLVRGKPEQALLGAAAGADVLVLGEGGVATRLLERAPGVVAVVPGRD